MSFWKKLFRRPAIFFVTLYAKYIYNQGVEAAEKRHLAEGNRIYLAAKTFHPDRLVTYNKGQFKVQKRAFGMTARLLTMNTLKQRCYYHTADRYGEGRLSEEDIAIRKQAFIKERLRYAGVV